TVISGIGITEEVLFRAGSKRTPHAACALIPIRPVIHAADPAGLVIVLAFAGREPPVIFGGLLPIPSFGQVHLAFAMCDDQYATAFFNQSVPDVRSFRE